MDMKNSLLCSAALLLCVVIVNFPPAAADCGGFVVSCTNINIFPTATLEAKCQGSPNPASVLDLDQHLGNIDGGLVPGSGFTTSCKDIAGYSMPDNSYWIEALCLDEDGDRQLAQFDLNSHVANTNGNIEWNNC